MTIPNACTQESGRLATTVQSIAALLRRDGVLSTGDVAVLRRMDPRCPEAPFFKVEGLLLDEQLPGDAAARADLESRWAAVIIGLAHLEELHRQGERLGNALVSAGYSELRFARLLRADSERLIDELPMLARYLSAKATAADWTHAAQLMLSAGRADEESTRRHLARDYYGALARERKV